MKILSIPQVREADSYTIENEPIASIDLMERAGQACTEWMLRYLKKGQRISIICGPGNNGGDGLVIARLLAGHGYEPEVLTVGMGKPSPDFSTNLAKAKKVKGVTTRELTEKNSKDWHPVSDVIVDAIFGSGLTRSTEGFVTDIIGKINDAPGIVVAIDIPSGLYADKSIKPDGGMAVRADYTLTLQFPKLAFMFPENELYVGEWHVIQIGLHPKFIQDVDVDNYYLEREDIIPMLKRRSRFAHKGDFGHALLIAGSREKMGAAILAAKAALRCGVGLLTVHIPDSGRASMNAALPEAMVSTWKGDRFTDGLPDLHRYSALAIGPGLGTEAETAEALKLLIQEYRNPILFDADALNLLAENPTWIGFLQPNSILTPHPGEFRRLTTTHDNDFERHLALVNFAKRHRVITVLKGGYTAIACTDGYCFFNSTGNPGMATAGSGDVLTGIILGLLAQRYEPEEAAVLGVYLHGMSGDIAATELGVESLLAGDITGFLHKAFNLLHSD